MYTLFVVVSRLDRQASREGGGIEPRGSSLKELEERSLKSYKRR